MSVLAGFPDRVARRRAGNQVLFTQTGGSAEVAGDPLQYEFMVAVDAEDRKDKPLPLIRMTARIEPEWLIELFPNQVREKSGVEWNRVGERVEAVSALLYDELVIQESRGAAPDAEAAAELLAQKALEAGIDRFVDGETVDEFVARVQFAGFEPPDIPQAVKDLCLGLRSFTELKNAAKNLVTLLEQTMVAPGWSRWLPRAFDCRMDGRRKSTTSRASHRGLHPACRTFSGCWETPCIGPELTPVVVHLLAPNQRAVQTTSDLAGFWERLYPQVRRELMRRYPRHSWPERP